MHELSIVMSIVELAMEQASKAGAISVEEIELEIGELTTIEMLAFEFAWQQGKSKTILEHAVLKVDRIHGHASCLSCNFEFPVKESFETCPACGDPFIRILKGKELRLKSLVVT